MLSADPAEHAFPARLLHWFDADSPADYVDECFPIFIWSWGQAAGEVFYGFPDLGGGVKLASETDAPCDPDRVERTVTAAESARFHARHIAGRLRGVGPRLRHAATCLYTQTPDARFLIDRLQAGGPIIVSACSGHGFKHSAAIGERVAHTATGQLGAEGS
ncbi:MAG: FAD-dependent oxidoreductase [Xanthomonadales bacterium]|nr:FAD-dependent oxidoreductase [Xanthomonadales bacterium]